MKKLMALSRHLEIDHAELFDLLLEFSTKRLKAEMNEENFALTAKRSRK